MGVHESATMRTVRFHDYGEPADVLRMDQAAVPVPGPGRIRVTVRACGLNPADWALCRGLFPGVLPRGIGLELSGSLTPSGAPLTGAKGSGSLSPRYSGLPMSCVQANADEDHKSLRGQS